jgi:GDP-L-fucose synthase
MQTKQKKIYLAGHRGMVGAAIHQQLLSAGCHNIVVRTHAELDLTNQAAVAAFFAMEKPDQVILAAARVGGIHANHIYPAEFIYQNLMIQSNVIFESWNSGCSELLFLGSSCIYPKFAVQPMPETALLTGILESTNEPYAIAKIAGIKLCESFNRQYGTDFRSVMPTNLYGQNDNFHLENSHVIPALIRRFHDAKVANEPSVTVWGSGNAMREFLHVDDMAAASLFIFNLPKHQYAAFTEPMLSHINVGTGVDVTIRELAETVKTVTGFAGEIRWDTAKPDGTPRKLLEVSRLQNLGWQAKISLEEGLRATYQWFLENQHSYKSH